VGDPNIAPLAGQLTATTAVAQIDRLVAAGGKTFVLASFSGLSGLPFITANGGDPAVANAFAAAYFSGMQAQLLPYAQAGVRFFLLDQSRLGEQVQANLGRYDLTGLICNVPAFPAPSGTPCDGGTGSPLQQQFLFGPDGLHFTNRGFEIIAEYMANIVMAPDTIAVQPGIVATMTGGFASSLLNRLAGVRQISGGEGTGDPDGPMGVGVKKPAGSTGGVTSFAMGTFLTSGPTWPATSTRPRRGRRASSSASAAI
jgi:phospholipase/lecithinase/hemolysin